MEPVGEALVAANAVAAVEGAAATDCITLPVVEGTYSGTGHVQLVGIDAACIAGDLAELPAFAVEVGVAIDAANGAIRVDDLLAHMVTHQIEAKAADLVVACPDLHRVDHQLGHHSMFAGGVLERESAGVGKKVE